MNLMRFFIKEEPIPGLEISDDFLRLSLVGMDGAGRLEARISAEMHLAGNIVANGILNDGRRFSETLKEMWRQAGMSEQCVIISLPADHVYFKIFSFPGTQPDALEKAMRLAADFQLPLETKDAYFDWEILEPAALGLVLLAAIPKKIVDAYAAAIARTGLTLVAVEAKPLSLARIADTPAGKAALVKCASKNTNEFYVIKDGTLRFCHVVPKNIGDDKKTAETEAAKIKEYYQQTYKETIAKTIEPDDLKIFKEFEQLAAGQNNNRGLVSFGAALRGLVSRSDDTFISLMNVGTEEAFSRQKIKVFARLASGIIAGVSIFFAAAFAATWMLVLSIEKNSDRGAGSAAAASTPANAAALETEARQLGGLVSWAEKSLRAAPDWSAVADEIKARAVSGITLAAVSMPALENQFTLIGVAQNRSQLNNFRKSLDESPAFADVKMPLTNLEQKENISFSITLRLKDPAAFYPK